MTSGEYLKQLEKYLRKLPQSDYEDAMEYFTEYFADSSSVCTRSTPIPANNRILRYEKGLSVTENGGPRRFSRQTAVHFVCVSRQR